MIKYRIAPVIVCSRSRYGSATPYGRPACYRGSVGAKNCALIQPFKRPFSTCTQFPSRFVTSKRVPFGAVPRTLPLVDGVDLMFTPGRCKKRISRLCAEALWRDSVLLGDAAEVTLEASTASGGRAGVMEGSSGRAAASEAAGEGSDVLRAAWTGVAGGD